MHSSQEEGRGVDRCSKDVCRPVRSLPSRTLGREERAGGPGVVTMARMVRGGWPPASWCSPGALHVCQPAGQRRRCGTWMGPGARPPTPTAAARMTGPYQRSHPCSHLFHHAGLQQARTTRGWACEAGLDYCAAGAHPRYCTWLREAGGMGGGGRYVYTTMASTAGSSEPIAPYRQLPEARYCIVVHP